MSAQHKRRESDDSDSDVATSPFVNTTGVKPRVHRRPPRSAAPPPSSASADLSASPPPLTPPPSSSSARANNNTSWLAPKTHAVADEGKQLKAWSDEYVKDLDASAHGKLSERFDKESG